MAPGTGPRPQAGYFVVFVPFSNGKPSGDWEVFADNFSGDLTRQLRAGLPIVPAVWHRVLMDRSM